jgi:probable rRNA maturation factor
MALEIEFQIATEHAALPSEQQMQTWLNAAAQPEFANFEVCVRIVDEQEITELNRDYRQKDKATNVLSFPADIPEELNIPLLGDIVICAAVVEQEAQEQNKTAEQHWAHMCVHGLLHLQGFDHIEDQEAEQMESLEINILAKLGFPSPYELSE